MSNLVTKNQLPSPDVLQNVLLNGDLSRLTAEQKISYYMKVCESVGLNPLTKPFDYIKLSGKEVLYAKRDATDQLRTKHNVSIIKMESKTVNDVHIVTAHAKDRDGREDVSTGAVCIANIKGDALANALMKAETKAKRRVTLSICGLGLLDETELETIPDIKPKDITPAPMALKGPPEFDEALDDAPYVFKFGQFQGRSIFDIRVDQLTNYLAWLKKQPKPSKDFIEAIQAIELTLNNPDLFRDMK